MTAVQSSIDAVRVAAVAADRMKAADIEAFDVSDLLAITDIMMVATAMNERQVIGVAEEVEKDVYLKCGICPRARAKASTKDSGCCWTTAISSSTSCIRTRESTIASNGCGVTAPSSSCLSNTPRRRATNPPTTAVTVTMPAKLMSDVSSPQAMPEHVRSITLIRHGRTSYNARHCFQGQIDIPLDEIGEWQVRQTAQALRSLYVESHPERRQLVVASDLSRAMATAHAFADPLGLVVHPDARVRERNFGEWEGKELAELERECPEDYRAWAEYRGGELRHGAETKAAVGERGRAALEEWSFSAGADTDLYVFSHGSWIAQTVQTVLGLGAIHPDFADVVSMGNAHWVRFVAADMPDGTLRWRLVDYNHGPALADTDQWEHPAL